MSPLRFKIYSPEGDLIGATKEQGHAIALIALCNTGAKIKHADYGVLWTEGKDGFARGAASGAFATISRRIAEKQALHRKRYVEQFGEDAR